ncbi:MAG: hypothetical protein DRP73_04165, partial [Candidatus Omnitrophota bacterium]
MGVGKKLRLFYFTILLTSVCLLDSLSLFPSSQVFHLRRLKSIEIESIVRLLKLPDAELLEKESRRLEGLPEEIKESEFAAMLIREALMRKVLSLIGVEALLAKEDLSEFFDSTRADNYPAYTAFQRLNRNFLSDIQTILGRKAEIEEAVDRVIGDARIDKVLILGMGGSGIAPQVMQGFLKKSGYDKVEIKIVKDALIPDDIKIDEHTLVVAQSYSGSTGETLSAFQDAVRKGAKHLIVISTRKDKFVQITENFSFIQIPVGEKVQPREAYSFTVPINLIVINRVLGRNGIEGFWDALDMDEALAEIGRFLEENPEWDDLSLAILKRALEEDKSLLFIHEPDPLLEAVTLRIFQQNSECRKLIGYNIEDSEFLTPSALRGNFIPVIIKTTDQKSYAEENLSSLNPIIVPRQSENEVANAMMLEIIFTRAIYGLSLFSGRDPIPVPLISRFKSIMKGIVEEAGGITAVEGDE